MKSTVQLGEKRSFAKKLRGFFSNRWTYLVVFLIPVLIMYAVYAIFRVHPFGSNSVLLTASTTLSGSFTEIFS